MEDNLGFEDAESFARHYGDDFSQSPSSHNNKPMRIDRIETPLGLMLAVCDEAHLFMLEFVTRKAMAAQFQKFYKTHGRAILMGRTQITNQIAIELGLYFSGQLTQFQTPFICTGTDFQKSVWAQLCNIPHGQTCSYGQLAQMIDHPKAVRAAASANAKNGLAIIVPCHRVISSDDGLGGYAGGVDMKAKLLEIEGR